MDLHRLFFKALAKNHLAVNTTVNFVIHIFETSSSKVWGNTGDHLIWVNGYVNLAILHGMIIIDPRQLI